MMSAKTFSLTLSKLIFTLLFFLLTGAMKPASPLAPPTKRALIIAIAAYDPATTGWDAISSDKDVVLIKNALVKIGFDNSNIDLLSDKDATKSGILKAIKNLEMKAQPGDHIVIHYSGHGHQIYDDNNDELDKLDEAIVAYGAFMDADMYDKAGLPLGSLHLRDDEFGDAVASLRRKIGSNGHVLVILDSCHSGTATRGVAKQRGGAVPLIPAKIALPASQKKETEGGFGIAEEKTRGSNDGMAKFILISGAAASQANFETTDDEGNSVGSLSYCISKALARLGDKQMSYRALFAQVQADMAIKVRNQQPQIEGDIDYKIFNGDYVIQQPYFQLSTTDDTTFRIDGGKLTGIFEGSTVYLERAGAAKKTNKPIAKGVVTRTSNFDATIEIDSGTFDPSNLKAYWVFPSEFTFGNKKLRISLARVNEPKIKSALIDAIGKIKLVEITETAPDLIIDITGPENKQRGASSNSLSIIDAQGDKLDFRSTDGAALLKSIPINEPSLVNQCERLVRNYAQSVFIKDIDVIDPEYNVQVSFIPRVSASGKDTLDVKKFIKGGILELPEGQMVYIKLKNTGTKKTFFNLIGISPNGDMYPMYPAPDASVNPQDYFLLPNQTIILWDYDVVIGPPYGNEICKVIASSRPVNLTQVINLRQNIATKGTSSGIDAVIGKVFDNYTTRGPNVKYDGSAKTSTYEMVYRIVPRQ